MKQAGPGSLTGSPAKDTQNFILAGIPGEVSIHFSPAFFLADQPALWHR